jgi:hypothetical protein
MPILGKGWELRVLRLGIQRSGSQIRTYGAYQAFLDGKPIDSLIGNVCECGGPGENSTSDTDKRIEEGRYPLYTQFGTRYRTVGYSIDVNVPGRIPMPGILVANTGHRIAILIHPGHPPSLYLSSIGCLNLTKPLLAADQMDFWESRARVIALIESLRAFAPSAFKNDDSNDLGAWLVVDGEPMKPIPDNQVAFGTGQQLDRA